MTRGAFEQAETGLRYDMGALRAIVVAQAPHAREAAQAALQAAGCVARSSIDLEAATRDPGAFEELDLVLVETAGIDEVLVDAALASIEAVARPRAMAVIAAIAPEQIDLVSTRLLGSRAQLLCDPSDGERVAAIAAAKWHVRGEVQDVGREAESLRLQRLNEEVARIADTLVRLTRGEAPAERGGVRAAGISYRGPDEEPLEIGAGELRSVIRARRLRSQFFVPELFADPAWDMLLDLFAATLEHRRVSVSSLCIAAAVPPTTALRWIGTMHDEGLFERHADPHDRRRSYIGLSDKGAQGMRAYARAVKRAGLPLV